MKSLIRAILLATAAVPMVVLMVSPYDAMRGPASFLRAHSAQAISLSTDGISPDSVKMRLAEEVFSSIRVPPALSGEFLEMYNRHRLEIDRMVADNPFLIWESLDIALDSLPALRAMNQNGGMLYLDKRTYSRAMGLIDQCEALASPKLGIDLERAKRLLLNRTSETDSGEIVIDLSE